MSVSSPRVSLWLLPCSGRLRCGVTGCVASRRRRERGTVGNRTSCNAFPSLFPHTRRGQAAVGNVSRLITGSCLFCAATTMSPGSSPIHRTWSSHVFLSPALFLYILFAGWALEKLGQPEHRQAPHLFSRPQRVVGGDGLDGRWRPQRHLSFSVVYSYCHLCCCCAILLVPHETDKELCSVTPKMNRTFEVLPRPPPCLPHLTCTGKFRENVVDD